MPVHYTGLGESRLRALEHPGSAAELCQPSVPPLPARARHRGMAKHAHSLAASALHREVDQPCVSVYVCVCVLHSRMPAEAPAVRRRLLLTPTNIMHTGRAAAALFSCFLRSCLCRKYSLCNCAIRVKESVGAIHRPWTDGARIHPTSARPCDTICSTQYERVLL
jgi:hypothetical protein